MVSMQLWDGRIVSASAPNAAVNDEHSQQALWVCLVAGSLGYEQSHRVAHAGEGSVYICDGLMTPLQPGSGNVDDAGRYGTRTWLLGLCSI